MISINISIENHGDVSQKYLQMFLSKGSPLLYPLWSSTFRIGFGILGLSIKDLLGTFILFMSFIFTLYILRTTASFTSPVLDSTKPLQAHGGHLCWNIAQAIALANGGDPEAAKKRLGTWKVPRVVFGTKSFETFEGGTGGNTVPDFSELNWGV